MLLDIVKKGSTDRSIILRIVDSADGTPETGVVFNSAGIDLWYRREGAAKTSITEATLSALTDAHSDGGFLHIADGYYRFDIPDAAFATAANYVDFGGTVTGMVVIGGRVRLTDLDLESSIATEVGALLDAIIPDSVPSDGTRPSIKQALYMVTQFLLEKSVSGTSVTVKKVDGATTLFTLSINDSTNPTSITRAS